MPDQRPWYYTRCLSFKQDSTIWTRDITVATLVPALAYGTAVLYGVASVLTPNLLLSCDVLIVGGGLAATWAAVAAAEAGAKVVLVDKG